MKKKYSVILENWGNIDYRQDPNAPVYGFLIKRFK